MELQEEAHKEPEKNYQHPIMLFYNFWFYD